MEPRSASRPARLLAVCTSKCSLFPRLGAVGRVVELNRFHSYRRGAIAATWVLVISGGLPVIRQIPCAAIAVVANQSCPLCLGCGHFSLRGTVKVMHIRPAN